MKSASCMTLKAKLRRSCKWYALHGLPSHSWWMSCRIICLCLLLLSTRFYRVFLPAATAVCHALGMYVLPSVSTFTNRNPSITRFQYDRNSFELIDYTVSCTFAASRYLLLIAYLLTVGAGWFTSPTFSFTLFRFTSPTYPQPTHEIRPSLSSSTLPKRISA